MLSSVKSNCGPGTQLNRLSKVRFNFSILPPGGICLKIFQRRHGENDNQLDLIKTIPVCFITPDMLTEFKLRGGAALFPCWVGECMQMKAVAAANCWWCILTCNSSLLLAAMTAKFCKQPIFHVFITNQVVMGRLPNLSSVVATWK